MTTEDPKLCRDCKWCSYKAEHSRCLSPQHPRNKERGSEARAFALVDPALKPAPVLVFCTLEREWSGPEHCSPEGRWWEPAEKVAPSEAPTLTGVES